MRLVRALIRALFYKLPVAGEIYTDEFGDPFNRLRWQVIETKKGWVKYRPVDYCTYMSFSSRRCLFHFGLVKENEDKS